MFKSGIHTLKILIAIILLGSPLSGCDGKNNEGTSQDDGSETSESSDSCGDEPDEENPCEGDDDDEEDEPSYSPLEGLYMNDPVYEVGVGSEIDIQTSSCDDEIKWASFEIEIDSVTTDGAVTDPFEGTLTMTHHRTVVNSESQLHEDAATDCVWAGGDANQIRCEWEVVETSIIVDGETLSNLVLTYAYTLDASYRNEKYWVNHRYEPEYGWNEDGYLTLERALKISCEGDDCAMISDHILPTGYPYSCDTTIIAEAIYYEHGW